MIDRIVNEFQWMYWNWPSAGFFGLLVLAIVALTVWDVIVPGSRRRGFLPIRTTRGDRLFIGIMTTLGLFLIWLAAVGNVGLWMALVVAVVWNVGLAKWG